MADMLTTAEACTRLRCHRNTLNALVRRGVIAPIRLSARRNLYRADDIDQLLDQHRHDDAAIARDAIELLAEEHAQEQRPLCPNCGRRRVNRGANYCTWCEQNYEAQLMHKRNWWDRHGNDQRAQRRQEEASSA